MKENCEEIMDGSIHSENVKAEEYRSWCALLIASVVVGVIYFVGFFIPDFIKMLPFLQSSMIQSIADKVIMLVQSWLVIVIMALALYSSIRFSIKKSAVICVVYAVISLILSVKSLVTSLSLFRIVSLFTGTTTSITPMTFIISFISAVLIILINFAGLLFLPRILKKQKSEIVLYSLCVIILVFCSWIISIICTVLFYNNNALFIIISALISYLLSYCIIMGLTYAVIRIILHLRSHKKAEIINENTLA